MGLIEIYKEQIQLFDMFRRACRIIDKKGFAIPFEA